MGSPGDLTKSIAYEVGKEPQDLLHLSSCSEPLNNNFRDSDVYASLVIKPGLASTEIVD